MKACFKKSASHLLLIETFEPNAKVFIDFSNYFIAFLQAFLDLNQVSHSLSQNHGNLGSPINP